MSEPFIGEIRIFGGNFAPRSWAFCDGQLLPIAQNTALFSLLGTTYGGDGRTIFALPDLRGRTPMHPGRGPGLTTRSLGQRVGVETVTLSESQIPNHTHSMRVSTDDADLQAPGTQRVFARNPIYHAPDANQADMAPQALLPTGGGEAHTNLQPYLVVSFIIALVGVYPPRS
jgi:microcystin-dependent protein